MPTLTQEKFNEIIDCYVEERANSAYSHDFNFTDKTVEPVSRQKLKQVLAESYPSGALPQMPMVPSLLEHATAINMRNGYSEGRRSGIMREVKGIRLFAFSIQEVITLLKRDFEGLDGMDYTGIYHECDPAQPKDIVRVVHHEIQRSNVCLPNTSFDFILDVLSHPGMLLLNACILSFGVSSVLTGEPLRVGAGLYALQVGYEANLFFSRTKNKRPIAERVEALQIETHIKPCPVGANIEEFPDGFEFPEGFKFDDWPVAALDNEPLQGLSI